MRYFILSHQNPYQENGYGRVLDDGTCEVVLKPGMCSLEKANTIQKFDSLVDVLEIDTVMRFRWTGFAPGNPAIDFPKVPKGTLPLDVAHWIFEDIQYDDA